MALRPGRYLMSGGRQGPDGIAIVDKEAGWTSHDVVARARGVLGTRKVGHSGTLDPDATGVLVLGVGRATRLLRFLTLLPKTYTCQILLGTETSTLDASGEVTAEHDMSAVSFEEVVAVTAGLVGEISQVPPMVSAIKVDGRRLYEIAREGGEVKRAARSVTVHRFDVLETDDPGIYEALVECSSGTYVRSLTACADCRLVPFAMRRRPLSKESTCCRWPRPSGVGNGSWSMRMWRAMLPTEGSWTSTASGLVGQDPGLSIPPTVP